MSNDDWMRPKDWKTLTTQNLKMARETLEEARIMAEHEQWRGYVNRLYYACFYAVSALLTSEKHSAKTHSGIRSLFAEHFVRLDRISKDYANFYDTLFDHRQRGDYEVSFEADPAVVRPWLPQAEAFVEAAASIASESSSPE